VHLYQYWQFTPMGRIADRLKVHPLTFRSDSGFTVRMGCLSVVWLVLVINPSKVKWKLLKKM